MGLFAKLSLLFKIQKPAGEVVDAVAEVKKTKKWVHFAVTILGVALTTVGAIKGFVPPQTMLLVTSILQAIYNIVRGADKADNADVKGTFTTTEFWMSILTEGQKLLVVSHNQGMNYPWLEPVTAILNFAVLSMGQNLAGRAPDPMAVTKTDVTQEPIAK